MVSPPHHFECEVQDPGDLGDEVGFPKGLAFRVHTDDGSNAHIFAANGISIFTPINVTCNPSKRKRKNESKRKNEAPPRG